MTMSEVLEDVLPVAMHPYLTFLSGPSFATEVARGMPTAVTIAGRWDRIAKAVQEAFHTRALRPYTSSDVIGVEIGGCAKNVVAIATGLSAGMGFGSNTRAALITRGLAEMARLGVARGARPATFAGLAGLGDLVLTCTGDLSRNRSLGLALAAGRTLAEIQGATRTVAEGVRTAAAAVRLAEASRVEMPIAAQVHRVLFEGASPRAALHELMTRTLKDETA
jgi:glycerol-3-phosphate dehydrogenase (NAD(P)+)